MKNVGKMLKCMRLALTGRRKYALISQIKGAGFEYKLIVSSDKVVERVEINSGKPNSNICTVTESIDNCFEAGRAKLSCA